jgi:hypothetical protein
MPIWETDSPADGVGEDKHGGMIDEIQQTALALFLDEKWLTRYNLSVGRKEDEEVFRYVHDGCVRPVAGGHGGRRR